MNRGDSEKVDLHLEKQSMKSETDGKTKE